MRHVESETHQPSAGEDKRISGPLTHLADTGVHVTPDLHDSKVRAAVQGLGAASQAGGSHHGPFRQTIYVVTFLGDEDVGRVVPSGNRREHYPLRNLGRHVLCGVYGEVYLPPQQRLVELAGKDVPLVYN